MKKIIEIFLIVMVILTSGVFVYFQENKLLASSSVLISVYAGLGLLNIFYLIQSKNKYEISFLAVMFVGIIGIVSSTFHWPGGFLLPLVNISMVMSSLYIASFIKKENKDKHMLFAICVSLFIYGISSLLSFEFFQQIGSYFIYTIMLTTLIYFFTKKETQFEMDSILKLFSVYSCLTLFSLFSSLIS